MDFVYSTIITKSNGKEAIKLTNMHNRRTKTLMPHPLDKNLTNPVLNLIDNKQSISKPHKHNIFILVNKNSGNLTFQLIFFLNLTRITIKYSKLITKISPNYEIWFIFEIFYITTLFFYYVVCLR